jgi:fluoroquinolone resistance protein
VVEAVVRTTLPGDEVFEGEVLEGMELTATLERRRFEGCTLRGWTAREVTLRRCVFEDCTFRGCDLSLAKLYESSFRDVRFERCRLMGVAFTDAQPIGFQVSFAESVISMASFASMSLRDLRAIDCKATEAIFEGADLRGACFSGTDLQGARFGGADLRGADLSSASGYAIDPREARLGKTKMGLEGALRAAQLLGIEVTP